MVEKGSAGRGSWLIYAAARRQRATALVLPWERRGDFQRLCGELTGGRRLAWRRIKRRTLARHLALLDALAGKLWLRIAAPERLDLDGRPARLRVDDDALSSQIPGAVTTRVVPRKTTVGLQVARLLCSALTTPDGDMSDAQREVAAVVRARWDQPDRARSTQRLNAAMSRSASPTSRPPAASTK